MDKSFWAGGILYLLEPLEDQDFGLLMDIVKQLKQADGESWAAGELLERAIRARAIYDNPVSCI